MNQPGLQLVYRKGYNSEDPKQPRPFAGPDLIKAALQGKTTAATQLLFDAKLEPAKTPAAPSPIQPKGKPQPARSPYDLLLAIPQSQITCAASPGGIRKVRLLHFAFDAYDLNGKFLGSHSQNVSLDLPVERFVQFIEEPVYFHEQLAFYPGPLFLRTSASSTPTPTKSAPWRSPSLSPKSPASPPPAQPPAHPAAHSPDPNPRHYSAAVGKEQITETIEKPREHRDLCDLSFTL